MKCSKGFPGTFHRLKQLGPIHTKDARFFSGAEILLRIYQNPIHLNGARWRTTFFRRRNSRCLQTLVRQRVLSKCMGFWYIRSRISAAEKNERLKRLSAAEFPQQKRTHVFGLLAPCAARFPCSPATKIIIVHFWITALHFLLEHFMECRLIQNKVQ